MERERLAHVTLRVGVAFAFLYPPLQALSDPISWLGYFPHFLLVLPAHLGFPVDSLVFLHGFGVIEAILALWILSGRAIRIPAILATLMLLAIVVFNWADMDIIFRDITIACMTLALAFWPQPSRSNGAG